jgi:hypothetical protein
MSIFENAAIASLPPDPRSLIEGQVTSTISNGIGFGSDPARTVRATIENVSDVNPQTANTLSPNFDRFSVLEFPELFGVTGNLFRSAEDLVPIANISSNFGGTIVGEELTQINVRNLLENPGSELSTFARNLSGRIQDSAEQQVRSFARSVVQDVKDVFRGTVNSILNPSAAATTNLGVVDSRLSYAFFGPRDANRRYAKGSTEGAGAPGPDENGKIRYPPDALVGFQGVEPMLNPHYVFRLNSVANRMSAGDDGLAQSRLLLDKESRMGVSTLGKREVTLSAILSKFGGFSTTNPTPYRAADFLWLKHYNRIPLTRLVTLRRYMFPIQDNLTRSPYFGAGTSRAGAFKYNGWVNNPVSQMVTYFGGETGNSLGDIIKITARSSWIPQTESSIQDITLFGGSSLDALSVFESSRVAKLFTGLAKVPLNLLNPFSSVSGGSNFGGIGQISSRISSIARGTGLTGRDLAAGALALTGLIDSRRFSGISSYLDTFNPYARGGYFSDLYREPYNIIKSAQKRDPGLTGGVMPDEGISLTFEYSLKAIGHINAKAAMLDIMSNILATTHYRGSFWGGEARFYLNKGIFPLLNEEQTLDLVKHIWRGDMNGAAQAFQKILQETFGDKSVEALSALLSIREASIDPPSKQGETSNLIVGGANTITSTQNASSLNFAISDKMKEFAAVDLLAGLFKLTGGDGNSAIPQFQALKTGAPVGEWHLTVGNPFKPIAVIGNLVCTGVDITFNDEMGSDDFPTEMKVTVFLKPGMSRANQDIESVFNDGFGPLYIPKPDLFENKEFDQVKEEISKQVASQGVYDFMEIEASGGVLSSLSNFTVNTSELPSAHVQRFEQQQNMDTLRITNPD